MTLVVKYHELTPVPDEMDWTDSDDFDPRPLLLDQFESTTTAVADPIVVRRTSVVLDAPSWSIKVVRRNNTQMDRRPVETFDGAARSTTGRKRLAGAWLAVCLLISALFGGAWLLDSQNSTPVQNTSGVAVRPIESIQVGERVIGENPTGDKDEWLSSDVDPVTWRRIELQAPKDDGTWSEIVLLRPVSWLEEHGVEVDKTIQISVPECGIDGNAQVLAITPGPRIVETQRNVVTGTFKHHSAHVVDLQVEGLAKAIGTTANHPFWSEDRKRFVRAGRLVPGERLRSRQGTARVIAVTPRVGRETVYNLEVNVSHVYHVAGTGILVHNNAPTFGSGPESLFGPLGPTVGTVDNQGVFGFTEQGIYYEKYPGGNVKFYPQGRQRPIRVQYHPATTPDPGKAFIPRHHAEHWHVEQKFDPTKGWDKLNTNKAKPPGWTPLSPTGFFPGEKIPTCI